MSDKSGDERVRIVHELIPPNWDRAPLSLAHELRTMLQAIVDQGTNIDSGGGDGCADLWPIIGGIEYHVAIKSNGPRKPKTPTQDYGGESNAVGP